MLLGAHVTTSKGLVGAVEKAQAMGASCLQLFVSPPRNWNPPKWSREELVVLKHKSDKTNIKPIFLHGIYLVNLHTENSETLQKAINSVVAYQTIAEIIGAVGTIIHSHRPNAAFKLAIDEIIARSPATPLLLIEHSAINTLEDTFSLFDSPNKHRLGFCLDTCHLFAASYDIRSPNIVDEILDRVDRSIGLDMLKVMHVNDCKSGLGSHRDIHANFGEGSIGKEPFAYWLNHPKLKGLPFIIETPGFDDNGPDKENLDILKSLIK